MIVNKRIIARIDLNNDQLVKGKFLEGLRKLGNPVEFIKNYYNDFVDEIIILDAVASLYGRNSNYGLIKEICNEFHLPVTIGGGIKSIKDIENAFKSGADKVALNTSIVNNLEFLKESIKTFGSQAIVGSIVTRRHRYSWEIFVDNAKHRVKTSPFEWARVLTDNGIGEIMLTSIDSDGRMKGFDNELLNKFDNLKLKIPYIVCGGIGNSKNITDIFDSSNCSGVVIASALHYNKISVTNIKKSLLDRNYIFRI